jgi:hypothetical protein
VILVKKTKKTWRCWGISIPSAHNHSPMISAASDDVLFISQIYNVLPELKHNKEQMLWQYSSSLNKAKPNFRRSAFLIKIG